MAKSFMHSFRHPFCVLLAAASLLSVTPGHGQEAPIARAVGSEGDMAAEALVTKFLAAKAADEVLPLILNAAKNTAAVQAFFAEYKVPTSPNIRLIQSDGGKKDGDSIFNVTAKEWTDPAAILVVKTAEGPKIDWGLFEEFYSQALLKFLENEEPGTGTFRVLLKRIHYFETDVPDLDEKECFQAAALSNDWAGNVFVGKSSSLMSKLSKQLPWGSVSSAVVSLKSHKATEGMWVEVVGVPSFFWTTTDN
ncbi:MAG: hypothetical protein H7A55_12380 [Verrucomicrobiaceae bacterium]|nr:hypothetical protein [Verrucomicrobiaceae bacterium]